MADEEVLGTSQEAVETLLRARMLDDLVSQGTFEDEPPAVVKPKNPKKATAWILMRDTSVVTIGSGPLRYRKGARIEDLHVKTLLENAGAPLEPTE